MSEMVDAVRRMVRSMIKPDVLIGQVTAFSESDWTITVKLNQGATVEEVRVQAVIPAGDSGLFVEPAINSFVVCALIEGKLESLCVLLYSDVVRYALKATDNIQLQSDSFGGLVKSEKVHTTDKMIIDEINALKQIINSWAPVPNDGGAAFRSLLSSWANPLVVPVKTDYENQKVKHGE